MQEPDSPCMETITRRADGLRAADFLRREHDAVLEAWRRAAQVQYAGRAHAPGLLDPMPPLLAALADAVEQGPERFDPHPAEAHAMTRMGQGFDVGELATEYALLRQCLLRRLEASGRPLIPGELERLEAALDRAMAHALTSHARARERAARQEAEHSLALVDVLLATAPVGLAFLDRDLRYLRINQTLADINRVPVADHLGHHIDKVLPASVADPVRPLLLQVLRTGEPIRDAEFNVKDETTGEERSWLSNYFPVRTASGELLGVGCSVVNITQHKRTEAALQRAVDFREQLLAVLGHDLRNPLHAITASAFLLGHGEPLDAPQQRAVERIRASTARMTRMINDILDFARSRLGGGIPVTRQHVDMTEVCRTTLEELAVAYPAPELRLESHGDTWGDWDPDRVAQVLGNLVVNAVRHGREGAPVRTRVIGEAHDVRMEVHNLGDPIVPEMLPRLFDPFKAPSAPDPAAQRRRSLGLGLYIVSQIAQVHGGEVGVRSTAEEGTTFTVTWPRRAPPGQE
ncbi:hypothetical protein DRW03_15950 [Corallococcus sp. H22C18031201]|nr:PAS domain-containing sensor histidine kinase [Citreicoccus inhibens]RJS21830.1 hypothetical protein DRW03_15950 [Corallococcus sp. H22C18031201]